MVLLVPPDRVLISPGRQHSNGVMIVPGIGPGIEPGLRPCIVVLLPTGIGFWRPCLQKIPPELEGSVLCRWRQPCPYLSQLHRELDATLIYVTHDRMQARTTADRIVGAKAGRSNHAAPR